MERVRTVRMIPLLIGSSFIVSSFLGTNHYITGSVSQKVGERSATSALLTNQSLYVQSNRSEPVRVKDRIGSHHHDSATNSSISPNKSSMIVPPLSSLALDTAKNVVGDPQFLLDFAIVGFAKCGTTTMSKWIGAHPEVQIPGNEMQALSEGRPAGAVKYLYHQYINSKSDNVDYKRGYKSPYDITNMGNSLVYLKKYWPKTRLIVGIRHPVHWLESFVNFRIQNGIHQLSNVQIVNSLVHKCYKLLCVKTANFHVFLDGLGKTNSTMLDVRYKKKIYDANNIPIPPSIPHKVFLYDMEQLADRNETRRAQFGRDIQEYLGLKAEMPPMIHANEGVRKYNETNNVDFIDICDKRHNGLRRELMKAARRASTWIRMYFLDSEDVYVSSREYLEEILASWMIDPCDNVEIKK